MFFVNIELPGIEQERMILDQVLNEPDPLLVSQG